MGTYLDAHFLFKTSRHTLSKYYMKSLYAYFGLLDLHQIDSPGHSLYQIGLVDSLRESFSEEKFDFYSYYPVEVIKSTSLQGFPDTPLGRLFH